MDKSQRLFMTSHFSAGFFCISKDSSIDSMIISMIKSIIVLSIFSKTVFAVSVLQKHFMGVIPPNSVPEVLIDMVLIPHTTSHNHQTRSSLGEAELQSSILIIILHPICTSSSSFKDFFSIFTLGNTNPLSSQKAGKTPLHINIVYIGWSS